MKRDKKHDMIVKVLIGALIILIPVFMHTGCFQSPFLYAKELLVKYGVSFILAIALWRYNKFLSLLFLFGYFSTFVVNLSTRSLWALSNLRDFSIYYLILRLFFTRENAKKLLWFWLIALILPIITTWLQFYGIDPAYANKDAFHGEFYANYAQVWRTRAFFGNPHVLHVWLAICTPLIFLLPLRFAIIGLALILSTIIMIGSRGPSIITCLTSAAFTFSFIRFKTKRILKFFALAIPIAATVALFKGQNFISCVDVRIRMFQTSFQKMLEHPIFGHGLNSYSGLNIRLPDRTLELQAHNEYTQTYVELGIFALLFLPFLIYYFKRIKDLPPKEGAVLGGLLYSFMLGSLYSFVFHTAHAALFFLTILAVYDTLLQKQTDLQI